MFYNLLFNFLSWIAVQYFHRQRECTMTTSTLTSGELMRLNFLSISFLAGDRDTFFLLPVEALKCYILDSMQFDCSLFRKSIELTIALTRLFSLSPHRRRRRRTHIQTRVVIQVGANQASVRERGASWLVIARDAMHTRTFYAIVNVNLTIELRSTTDGHLR